MAQIRNKGVRACLKYCGHTDRDRSPQPPFLEGVKPVGINSHLVSFVSVNTKRFWPNNDSLFFTSSNSKFSIQETDITWNSKLNNIKYVNTLLYTLYAHMRYAFASERTFNDSMNTLRHYLMS